MKINILLYILSILPALGCQNDWFAVNFFLIVLGFSLVDALSGTEY